LIRVPDEHRRFDLVSFFVVGSGAGKSESPLVLIGKAEPQRP